MVAALLSRLSLPAAAAELARRPDLLSLLRLMTQLVCDALPRAGAPPLPVAADAEADFSALVQELVSAAASAGGTVSLRVLSSASIGEQAARLIAALLSAEVQEVNLSPRPDDASPLSIYFDEDEVSIIISALRGCQERDELTLGTLDLSDITFTIDSEAATSMRAAFASSTVALILDDSAFWT